MNEIIVAVTGASGAAYAVRLLNFLAERGIRTHVVITEAGAVVLEKELDVRLDLRVPDLGRWIGEPSRVTYHHYSNIGASIASGTCAAEAMVIVPCSMNTLGAIASGLARNLIERAAAVMMKEGRPLILVPRETPLSAIHLQNMTRLAEAGACVLPPMPGFYHRPRTLEDMIDFVVGKILNRLRIDNDLVAFDAD
ncbi:MAG: UbiX family flavin prenyltransferase [Planctomycetes bacterium]|nr:UbiX family flavin prenyltransferase [Planctomycetota bacterium]